MRNRRGRGLLGTVARTAVITTTATATNRAVSGAMDQKAMQAQQERTAAMQAQAEMEQMKAQLAAVQLAQVQAAAAPAPAPVAPEAPAEAPAAEAPAEAQTDLLAQLTQLAQLKDAGALSEEEFQLAKAKLLN